MQVSSARKGDLFRPIIRPLLFFNLACLLLLPFSSASPSISERAVLLDFKSSVSDPLGVISAWISTNSSDELEHCSWYGVVCGGDSRVSEIRVPGGGNGRFGIGLKKAPDFDAFHGFGMIRSPASRNGSLIGALPSVIAKLTEIRVLSVPFHEFAGEIPAAIWDLQNLEVLDLEGNSFTGKLPVSFNGLRDLRVLNLGHNQIHGEIPHSLSRLLNLDLLNLAGNQIRGPIPRFLSMFSKLTEVHLSSNQLQGSVPSTFGQLQNLKLLDVSMNNLDGPIPTELGNCTILSVLILSRLNDANSANGESNSFQGALPVEVASLPKLKVLWAPGSSLKGEIPSKWSKSLEVINLSQNFLTGEIKGGFRICRNLSYFDVSSNKLTGKLDRGIPVPCMVVFDVSGNLFSGSIPRFSHGVCPPSNGKVRVVHNFGKNNFTGAIPSLPIARSELSKIGDYVFLAEDNKLNGNFPWRLFDSCHKLNGLFVDVSNNRLSGRIPAELSVMCRSLKFLNASGNEISGFVPQTFGSIEVLRNAIDLRNLRARLFNVKEHNEKFHSQDLARRSLLDPSSDSSSEDLQSNPPSSSTNSSGDGGDNKFNSIEIASIVSASAIVIVLLALVILFVYTRKYVPKGASRVQVLEKKEIIVFSDIGVPLTFQNIVKATEWFSTRNCIGSGGFGATYKAEVSPGVIVAVKRLSVGRIHCVQHFHAEIKTLGRIRHQNLVTLIGYHASETEMFLIYNYFPGGNLEKFILDRPTRPVFWKVLHKIALDVASALAYLHDSCDPRVVHRDVKPSNILLDSDSNAYLSDFGLSRLLGDSETHATTGVEGTFGYLAPEYAMTCRVSEKADVYSYGVVLLELISNKRALDPSFSAHVDGFNIVSWACLLLRQGRAKEVFVSGLWDSGPRDDLVEVLHLAVRCTLETLSVRPTMKQVVQRLKQLRPVS